MIYISYILNNFFLRNMMFLSLFSKPTPNEPELLVRESHEEDFLCIDFLDDFDSLSEKNADTTQSHIQEEVPKPILIAKLDTKEEIKPCIQAQPTLQIEKMTRRLYWESRNKKVEGIIQDSSGRMLEIRRVNQGKQLAFWDDEKNSQVYVPRTLEIKPKMF